MARKKAPVKKKAPARKKAPAKKKAPARRAAPRPSPVLEQAAAQEGTVAGRINMADDVVAAIAGITARKVSGIHDLGRSRLIPFGDKPPGHGVGVEMGKEEVALDLEVVIEHGCDIRQTCGQLRRLIARDILKMTGRKVVEVNVDVIGIEVPDDSA